MKRISLMTALALGFLLVAFTSPASAGFYYGGSVGQASADVSTTDFDDGGSLSGSVDDSPTDWRLYGGYKFFKFLAVEASWLDMGKVTFDGTSDGSGVFYDAGAVTTSQSADGYSISTLGTIPVGTSFQVFAKVGYVFWDADLTLSNTAFPGGSLSANDDGNDLQYGAGFAWDYTGPGSLRFDYEIGEVAGVDIDNLSAGLAFRF